MIIPSQEVGIELLNSAMPHPEQMKDFDLSDSKAIRFTWRFTRFKVELTYCSVWEVQHPVLACTDACILIERLLKKELVNKLKL